MNLPTLYDTLLKKVKDLGANVNVTWKVLSLGTQSANPPYWYAQSFSAGTSIEALIFPKAAQQLLQGSGLYVKLDSLCLTKSAVNEGDILIDAGSNSYRVVSVKKHTVGDVLVFYEADLVMLLNQAIVGA